MNVKNVFTSMTLTVVWFLRFPSRFKNILLKTALIASRFLPFKVQSTLMAMLPSAWSVKTWCVLLDPRLLKVWICCTRFSGFSNGNIPEAQNCFLSFSKKCTECPLARSAFPVKLKKFTVECDENSRQTVLAAWRQLLNVSSLYTAIAYIN